MKRTIWVYLLLFVSTALLGQTQQGRVKTIGRPDKVGQSLSGVTVRVSGAVNTVVTNTEGTFSFPLRSQRFKFSRISKKGYELADMDFLHYDFGFSPNVPVTIAMVSKEELAREREAIEESTRNKLSERFQKENAILESKLERMQISEEDYRMQLLALHEKYDNIDTLVSVLSDRYARTDYDNIDSLRLLVNKHIENGELERAQQLILSKGDLDMRLQKNQEKTRLARQMAEDAEKEGKDLAEDLFQLYIIAKNHHQYDSAYVYLEKRYLTDTTQVKYLFDLALAYFPSRIFPIGEREHREDNHLAYLFKLLNVVHNQSASSIHGTSLLKEKAIIEDIIGYFYQSKGNDEKAVVYFNKELQTIIDGKIGNEYSPLQSIGYVYLSQKDYKRALAAYQKAFEYCKKRHVSRLSIQKSIANTYYLMGETEKALKEYISVEENYKTPNDSDEWEIKQLYVLQGFIAKHFSNIDKNKEAIAYYEKAAQNAERYYGLTNNSKHIKPVVALLKELQKEYASRGEYKQMYKCAEKAMNFARLYVDRLPSAYSRLLYAEVLCQMADAHANMGKTSTVEQELVECLKKSEFASNIFTSRYQSLTYMIYNTFAIYYYKEGKYKEALNAINKSISILPEEIQAYQRKRDILNAIGEKEGVEKIGEEILRLTEREKEKRSVTFVFPTNPLLQYEYNFINYN